jgi:hypothetical protein
MTTCPKQLLRLGHLVAAACIVQSFIVAASAQLLVRPMSSELPAIPGKLDPALLPPGASQLVVETSQIFQLVQGEPPVTLIIPVHFKTAIPVLSGTGTSDNCGVYLLPEGGKLTFQLLVSESLVTHEQCFGGVVAIGAHIPPSGIQAVPIFIYKRRQSAASSTVRSFFAGPMTLMVTFSILKAPTTFLNRATSHHHPRNPPPVGQEQVKAVDNFRYTRCGITT